MVSPWCWVSLPLPLSQQTLLNDHSILSGGTEMQWENPSEHSVLSSPYNWSEMSCKMKPICHPCSKLMRSTLCVWAQVPPGMASAEMLSCCSFQSQTHFFLWRQSPAQSESAFLFFLLISVSLWAHLSVDQRAPGKPCWEHLFLWPLKVKFWKKWVLPKTRALEAGSGPSFLKESVLHKSGLEPFSIRFSLQCPMTDLISGKCMCSLANYKEGLVPEIAQRSINVSWGLFPQPKCHRKWLYRAVEGGCFISQYHMFGVIKIFISVTCLTND